MRFSTLLAIASGLILTCVMGLVGVPSHSIAQETATERTDVVLRADIEWGPLNPARGDASPQAGTLWGDRNESGPSGFLVKFVEGFSSPSHIHNVTYRGVVISGLIHNDDPDAQKMWMSTGSFWTQPAGESHITAADSSNNLAYIEIEEGPYLVRPAEEAFDNGERPVNVEKSNLVWLDASNITWMDQLATQGLDNKPEIAFLWGNPQEDQLNGTLVKLPIGLTGNLLTIGSNLRAVIIQGQLQFQPPGETYYKTLEPGSYFSSKRGNSPKLSCDVGADCIIYIRSEGKFNMISGRPQK